MKKILFFMALLPMLILSSCSNDDDFDYPMDAIYGTWDVTDIKVEGKWYDITTYPYTKYAMSISFKSDGSYYGKGYFGNGSGTYTAKGKTIITYIDGKEFAVYTVKSLSDKNAELTMTIDDEVIDIKAVKK